jgi:predicted nucleic acid-binding protein
LIVVDTNIIAYRWLPGPHASKIDQLLTVDAEWAAPLLWRSEFRNILAGYLRRSDLTLLQTESVLAMARKSLNGGEYAVADEAVMRLVAESTCTAYDCEFVALAQALGTLLVTEDKALLKAFPKTCRSLSKMIG